MMNFSDIVQVVKDTCNNVIGFMNILIPLLISLMIYTGSITTSGVLEPIILFLINFIGNIIQTLIIPIVLIFTSLIVISKISDNMQIDKLSQFLINHDKEYEVELKIVIKTETSYVEGSIIEERQVDNYLLK